MLNDASHEITASVKLHFELRIEAKDYDFDLEALSNTAEAIPARVLSPYFSTDLIRALNEVSERIDGIDYSRYGWMTPVDITILNSMALPFGDVRDPVEIPIDNTEYVVTHIVQNSLNYFLLGIALASLLTMFCVFYLYIRLKQEHAALEKDKVMGGSLRRIWDRFTKMEKSKGGRGYTSHDVQMTQFSDALESGALMADDGDDHDSKESPSITAVSR